MAQRGNPIVATRVPKEHAIALDSLAERRGVVKADLLREAVASFLEREAIAS